MCVCVCVCVCVYVCMCECLLHVLRDAKVPDPPAGHKWKAVSRDNSVTWLASWTENIQGQIKYVMLNPTSRIKVQYCSCVYVRT